MLKKITLIIVLWAAHTISYGQTGKQSPFTFGASYAGDTYYNTTGGLARGGGFMGMANLTAGVDTWRGGTFFVNGASIHGKSLSENYLGDLQVASNIDAGNHLYFHELWFRQQAGPLAFTAGLQDLNAEFMVSGGGGEFLNSSFGVPPVIATGVPVPIFPLTGLGVAARWDINERVAWQTAVFDGDQTAFDRNPHNVHWSFSRRDGVLAMTEVHLDERYKLGVYYHSADENYGFYALIDQPVSHDVSLFAQAAVAPRGKNGNNYSLGLGVNYLPAGRHAAGLAATHAGLHSAVHRHETAVELYYKYSLNDHIALQPDIQWIIHPSGTGHRLPGALVGILRVQVEF